VDSTTMYCAVSVTLLLRTVTFTRRAPPNVPAVLLLTALSSKQSPTGADTSPMRSGRVVTHAMPVTVLSPRIECRHRALRCCR